MAGPNTSRLLVLGTLAGWGQMHGHQILRLVERSNAELWSTIRAGSIYGVLTRLEEEGLIHAVRTERQGRFPERTVYAISDAGRQAFEVLLNQGLQWVPTGNSDPFDVVLTVIPPDRFHMLVQSVGHRTAELRKYLDEFCKAERELYADPEIPRAAVMIVRHMIYRLRAELAWLADVEVMFPELEADFMRNQCNSAKE